jgi:hypothetical protein
VSSVDIWYLENIIDYAGTFPPAALAAAESVNSYRNYRQGDERWIVGSLAWACSSLNALTPLVKEGDEFELALIGRPSTSWESWLDAREQDIQDINKALEAAPGLAAATYESKVADLSKISESLGSLRILSRDIDIYVELPWDEPIEEALAEIAAQEWARVKFRTGGATKEAYPTPEQLANVIKQCVDLEVEFKLTAGLHEPIAHIDESNGAFAHGFLNVMMATAIAFEDDASVREMAEVLASADPSLWGIKKGLSFDGKVLDEDGLNNARSFFGSFGSCSVSEPLQGLQRLGS